MAIEQKGLPLASGCRLWGGAGFTNDSPAVRIYGDKVRLARIAWSIHNARPVPPGCRVRVYCGRPRCLVHLTLVTPRPKATTPRAKLTDTDRCAIQRLAKRGMSERALALRYHVAESTIHYVKHGGRKRPRRTP